MKKSDKLPFGFWFFLIQIIAIVGMFGWMLYRAQPENCINYGNEEYSFVLVSVGSGSSNHLYAGTIKNEDYAKWVNGETGTIFCIRHISMAEGGD